jgi:hypothetical protein
LKASNYKRYSSNEETKTRSLMKKINDKESAGFWCFWRLKWMPLASIRAKVHG